MIQLTLIIDILMLLSLVLKFICAFLLGSIPFGIIVCELCGLKNPTTYGSTNMGASNVARQHKAAGFLTLILDALKGFLAITLLSANSYILFAVVSGHCFSPLMRFNGGKGVATGLGGCLALFPHVAATLALLWAVVFWRSQKPFIASLACAFVLMAFSAINHDLWLVATTLLIITRHASNVSGFKTQQ